MTVAEAIAAFREQAGGRASARDDPPGSLDLLARFLSGRRIISPGQITPGVLREFVARWYVEEATLPSGLNAPPEPLQFLKAIEELFNWLAGRFETATAQELIRVIDELRPTMPRAVEIGKALSREIIERGGAFAFPEFLTSFEEGGRSQYDIDAPGEIGAVESYFRITRIEETRVEVEDVITDEVLWPVLFPEATARLIAPGFILNLELARSPQGWHISDCGFTYPPGTEI